MAAPKGNRYAAGSVGAGQPMKFKTVTELQDRIDLYFSSCHNLDGECTRPYTITGLALDLDVDRHTLLNYGKNEDYFATIKKAKLKIENYAEQQLYTNRQTAGVIFNLKNNYGWVDKQDIDLKHDLTININLED